MNQLGIIKGNGKTVKVIRRVAAKWEEVATSLHFDGHDIERIKRDHNNSCLEACRTVFMEWLEGEGLEPITWETLIKVLNEAGFSEPASDLEHVINNQF